jgi:hypothetical protein
MSEGGFHVHGPHDHEMEHARDHAAQEAHHGIGGKSMTSQIALFTAIMATVGAIFAYMGGITQANAVIYKNNAAIKKTEASNQWNFYQAKSNKQNLSELAAILVADDKKAFYAKEVDRYKGEKAEIKLAADKLDAEATQWDEKSENQMHLHHRWAEATTTLEVSIALAAIALMTKKRWLEWSMLVMGGLGLVIGALAIAHV